MAYTIPTVQDFKDRFPELTATDPQIQAVIDEGARAVDTSWLEGDYAPAILYYAAHLLEFDASGIGGAAGIASESFGPISVAYKSPTVSTLLMTSYGYQFSVLRQRNKGGPRTA